jgi:hypothetical protein
VIYDVYLTNVYGAEIPAEGISGYFNNKLQGYLMAPSIIDTNAVVGSHLDLYLSVREVNRLWGIQYKISVDPAILHPVDFEFLAPLNVGYGGLEEIGSDYFSLVQSSYMGDPNGLTTSDPYAIVRLGFTVMGVGVTPLHLYESVMADAGGNKLIHGLEDGVFANTYDISVSLDTGFLETHNYILSQDTDGLITLTGQVKNTGVGIAKTRVRFTVLGAAGVVAEPVSDVQGILPGGNYRFAVDLPATSLLSGVYDVVFRVEYYNAYGAWVAGMKGSPSANRVTMVKTMTVEV